MALASLFPGLVNIPH